MKLLKKGLFSAVIMLVLTVCLSGAAYADTVEASPAPEAVQQPAAISVFINGVQIPFSVDPVIENGKTLVPLRAIFEALGATVNWENTTRTVTAVKGTDTIIVSIDNPVMLKNGEEITLDVPARLISGSTMVPVRAVSEGLGANVEWNGELRQVLISTMSLEELLANSYDFTELSDADMQALKESYYEIRYAFEQISFPSAIFATIAETAPLIGQKNSKAADFAKEIWELLVVSTISYLQDISSDPYIINADEIENAEQFIDALRPLIKEAGLQADSFFKVSFETLADKSVLMLLTFNDTDGYLACKYIGIVTGKNNTLRYFTAEADPVETNSLFFCEITPIDRGTLDLIGFEKKDFIKAVETVLAAD